MNEIENELKINEKMKKNTLKNKWKIKLNKK